MKIEVFKNDTLHISAITDNMVAVDYLEIIQEFIKLLRSERDVLEREANASGRTLDHVGAAGSHGSLPIPDHLDEI